MDNQFDDLEVKAPELSFDIPVSTDLPAEAPAQSPEVKVPQEDLNLTEEEMRQVEAFVDQIDLSNSQAVMSYGVGAQKKIADFSEKALDNVRTKDMGEVGDMITGLITELKSIEIDENEKGLKAFFKKKSSRMEAIKAKYSKVETNVMTISNELEKRQRQLMKDAALMDRMYEMNLNYFTELTMYIIAGKKKLKLVRENDLAELQRKAAASGLPEDVQAANDLAAQCDRFEKKLYDLELTRTIAIQTAPQIRMVQSSDTVMAEKIQSTIVNTIPLWKNQMVISMGVEHSLQAAKAQREVTDMTNALLKKNADKLKQSTIETARASERGIVDIETLRHTNEALISTLDEIAVIQREGKEKRATAEAELADIEMQLKSKLLEMAR
jgi:uncharacterized protein YaaN involved in tellurite resistance